MVSRRNVIEIITFCGEEMIESEKQNKNVPGKYKWETSAIIALMSLIGVNHVQPKLNKYKRMVHCYSTDKTINKFAIGYMINPSLNFKNVFIIQVENAEVFHFLLGK